MAFDGDKSNSVKIDGTAELAAALGSLPDVIKRKYLAKAVDAGTKVVVAQLLANTPEGPTGNLKRAVGREIRKYGSGVVFGVVGYRRFTSSKTDDTQGFHSHFLEKGTNDRSPKGPFLSSFGISDWRPPSWYGAWPMFARKVRGVRAVRPLGRAFEATKGIALDIIVREMKAGLEKGIEETKAKGL